MLALGLQLYLKHGIKLVLQDFQNKELMTAFDSSMCDEDYNNAFCILLPPGKVGKLSFCLHCPKKSKIPIIMKVILNISKFGNAILNHLDIVLV